MATFPRTTWTKRGGGQASDRDAQANPTSPSLEAQGAKKLQQMAKPMQQPQNYGGA